MRLRKEKERKEEEDPMLAFYMQALYQLILLTSCREVEKNSLVSLVPREDEAIHWHCCPNRDGPSTETMMRLMDSSVYCTPRAGYSS